MSQEQEDISFLARRAMEAGSCSFSMKRDCGTSSNSIVGIAYGIVRLEDQELPSDKDDFNACWNMWGKLPPHRKIGGAVVAMERAKMKIYPKAEGWE
jgi:hypothetical protein